MNDRNELHRIVQRNYLGHKMEVYDYCGGHLNENYLWKPPTQTDVKGWEGAHKPAISLKESVRLPVGVKAAKEQEENVKLMDTAMMDFTLGIDGVLPGREIGATSPKKTPQSPRVKKVLSKDNQVRRKDLYRSTPRPSALERRAVREECEAEGSGERSELRNSRILIEEYPASKIFLPEASYPDEEGFDKKMDTNRSVDADDDRPVKPCDPGVIYGRPTYMLEPSKTLQYNKMMEFRDKVVREKDTQERAMMTGIKAVEHLEMKLRLALTALGHKSHGPNFHRLQVYSEIFDDLIRDSTLFGPLLHEIKVNYDKLVTHLLDAAPPQHQLLAGQLRQLVASGAARPGALEDAQDYLEQLETAVLEELDAAKKLEDSLSEEEEMIKTINAPRPGHLSSQAVPKEPAKLTEAEKLEEMRADCWTRLEEIEQLRRKLNSECSPAAICAHLDQCNQETEIELQKVEKEKKRLTVNIEELQKEFDVLLEGCEMSEKSEQRILKYINGPINPTKEGVSTDSPEAEGQQFVESDSETEENNWSWYIS